MKNDLTVILPTHNEFNSIHITIAGWKKELQRLKIKHVIIVAEDGSNDGTVNLLQTIKNKYRLRIISSRRRLGYGIAIIRAIRAAKTKWILSVDSDGQCDPKDLISFWKKRKLAPIIIGNRIHRKDPVIRIILSTIFRFFFYLVFPSNIIRDPSCPFVLYRKKIVIPFLRKLHDVKEPFWWMFIGLCNVNKIPIYQVPITHKARFLGNTKSYKIQKFPGIFLTSLLQLIRLRL